MSKEFAPFYDISTFVGSSLRGKVAIITGGGRGIGAACAQLFVENGAKVCITSRTKSELQKTAADIESKHGPDSIFYQVSDVSDEKSVNSVFAETQKRFGLVDLLINNAAIALTGDFIRFDAKSWDEVMAINLRGPFLCSKEAFLQMKSKGGAIVNISSLGGIRGTQKFKGMAAYSVSKHGIVGLTECLAVEGKEYGIRVNCVAPGAVDTEMLKKAAPFLKTETTPLDVAKTILFLCDPNQSAKLTGAVIEIHSNA